MKSGPQGLLRPAFYGIIPTYAQIQKRDSLRMKYAIMSDVHANPMAMETALADAKRKGCERIVFLGDITGYGYDAKAALKLVRERAHVSLMGNHDSVCLGREPEWLVGPNPNYALDVAARTQLDFDEKAWMAARPLAHFEAGAAFVHGEFFNPHEWGYIIFGTDALRNFMVRSEPLMFCGHSHHAGVWEMDAHGKILACKEKVLDQPAFSPGMVVFGLKPGCRYIVNVGSVGYPRCDFCSTYAIWESDINRITLRRLPFPFTEYVKCMLERNIALPAWLEELVRAAAKKEGKACENK